MVSSGKADLLLLFIVVIWGATFPLIHNSVVYMSPSLFVATRFLLAIIVLLPFVWHRFGHTNRHLVFAGIILGLLNGGGYYAQTVGLTTIGSADSAFITSTTVILIPLILPLFKLGRPTLIEGLAVLLCLFGVYILTGSNLAHFSVGYLWTTVVALTTALTVLYMQKVSAKVTDYLLFTFYQLVACASIPIILVLMQQQWTVQWNGNLIFSLLYCAILASIVPFFIQSRFQQYTNPTRVGIIFTLEPVFASIFALVFNNEPLTRAIYLGGGIILVSLILCELGKHKKT
jgi:drug/metabolite transporter (DMT)-like permease